VEVDIFIGFREHLYKGIYEPLNTKSRKLGAASIRPPRK
jgi:hypothetical protein